MSGDQKEREPHERAADLLRFMAELRRLGSRPAEDFRKYDPSLLLQDVPDHPAITIGCPPDPTRPDLLLEVARLPPDDPPRPEGVLDGWVSAPFDDPAIPPELRVDRLVDAGSGDERMTSSEVPGLEAAYREWRGSWDGWAARRRLDQPARELYRTVFDAYGQLERSDEHELVLGVGMIGWGVEGRRVRRHLVTAPAQVDLDSDSGTLTVTLVEAGPAQLEDEVLKLFTVPDEVAAALPSFRTAISEASVVPGSATDDATADDSDEFGPATDALHLLDEASPVRHAIRRLAVSLHPSSNVDDAAMGPAPAGDSPRVHFAPALLVRPRGDAGIIRLLQDIIDDLEETAVVPDGLLPLVEPDQPIPATDSPDYERTGAFPELDGVRFGAVPLNERQEQVLSAVDRNASILVQGPPGTGKTHTIGALLTHLLAQGKRVLVTAHTDQALTEVRNKLPEPMRPLAVSVIGRGRDDNDSLDTAVSKLSERAGSFDPAALATQISHLEGELAISTNQRAAAKRAIYLAREQVVNALEHGPYSGRAGAIANELVEQAGRLSWLHEVAGSDRIAGEAPLTDAEAAELVRLWTDPRLSDDADEADLALADLEEVPTPAVFADLVRALEAAESAAGALDEPRTSELGSAVAELEPAVRAQLLQMLTELDDTSVRLGSREEVWMDTALQDVLAGRAKIWTDRAEKIRADLELVTELLAKLPAGTRVTIHGGQHGALRNIAEGLRIWLRGGKTITTDLAGSPKLGVFTPIDRQAGTAALLRRDRQRDATHRRGGPRRHDRMARGSGAPRGARPGVARGRPGPAARHASGAGLVARNGAPGTQRPARLRTEARDRDRVPGQAGHRTSGTPDPGAGARVRERRRSGRRR